MDLRGLNVSLENLYSCTSSTQFRDTIETLLRIHRNILSNKTDSKYRTLKLQNPVFQSKVWCFESAKAFMIRCGWIQVGDVLEFHNDEHLLKIIDVLIDCRLIGPKTSEWKKETKIENLYVSQRKENELRRKAALERQKELEEFEKDKKEREELARKIKRQIEDDKKHRRLKNHGQRVNN